MVRGKTQYVHQGNYLDATDDEVAYQQFIDYRLWEILGVTRQDTEDITDREFAYLVTLSSEVVKHQNEVTRKQEREMQRHGRRR